MAGIEIHLDGKPVSKLQAAQSVATPLGGSVVIGVPNADGWIRDCVTVYASHPAYGSVAPPHLSCSSFNSDVPAEIRQRIEMMTIAAEIIELAAMIADEAAPGTPEDGARMDTQDILIAASAIGNADIRPDGTANVIAGARRLCFGPSRTDGNGQVTAPNGWDATEYTRDGEDEDGPLWREAGYVWAETDAEMIALAAKYARRPTAKEINDIPDPDARRNAWLNWSPGRDETDETEAGQ